MNSEAAQPLRVEHALEAVRYRVYPETPLSEVIDLMVRRELHAVPVVGESFEVLGIITVGDALDWVLSDQPAEEVGAEAPSGSMAARDVMTRSVMCVSETQELKDAARMMVHRDVEQLPVVREGELIGLVTREAILRALHPGSPDNDEPISNDDE